MNLTHLALSMDFLSHPPRIVTNMTDKATNKAFNDPVAYLASLGIAAELVVDESPLPAAA